MLEQRNDFHVTQKDTLKMAAVTVASHIKFLFTLAVIFVRLADTSPAPWCPSNSTGHLQFSDTINKVTYARVGHMVTLHCCAYGYDSLEWYKNVSTKKCAGPAGWQPFPWGLSTLKPERYERNQTLRLNTVTLHCSKGLYKCIARNLTTGEQIEQTMNLKVMDCDSIFRPIFTEKPKDQFVRVGSENVTITCAGYYGCDKANRAPVFWRVVTTKGKTTEETPASSEDGITENQTSSDDTTIYRSTLTIKKIKREFIGMRLKCLLGMPSIHTPNVEITLLEKVIPKSYRNVVVVLSIVCGSLLFFLLVGVVTYMACGPYITFNFRRLCGKLPKRGDCKFDGIVIATEEDYEYVSGVLYPKLEKEEHYKIHFPERDITSGRPQLEELAKIIRKCYTVIVVYSCSFVACNLQGYIFDMITTDRPGNIVLIEYEPIPKELIKQMEAGGRSLQQQKIARKLFTKAHWPGNDCKNPRKLRNFWSVLFQNLPRVEKRNSVQKNTRRNKKCEDRNSICDQLLRDGDRELSSVSNTPVSAERDEIFRFDHSESVGSGQNDSFENARMSDTVFPFHRNESQIEAKVQVHEPQPNIKEGTIPKEHLDSNAKFFLDFPSESSEMNEQSSDNESLLPPISDVQNQIPIASSSQRPGRPIMTQASADSGYASVQSSGNMQSLLNNQASFEEKNQCSEGLSFTNGNLRKGIIG